MLRHSGYASWFFNEDGSLSTTTKVHAAISQDPRTGREVFFNQVLAAYTGWNDQRNQGELAVTVGGKLLDRSAMLDIASFVEVSSEI